MKKLYVSIGLVVLFACSNEAETHNHDHDHNHGSTEQVMESNASINEVVSEAIFKKKMQLENMQLVDVRTPDEFNEGHIEGALNYDFFGNEFNAQLKTLDPNTPILVYCKSGGRSGKTAALLAELGCKEIYDLSGGYSNWSE